MTQQLISPIEQQELVKVVDKMLRDRFGDAYKAIEEMIRSCKYPIFQRLKLLDLLKDPVSLVSGVIKSNVQEVNFITGEVVMLSGGKYTSIESTFEAKEFETKVNTVSDKSKLSEDDSENPKARAARIAKEAEHQFQLKMAEAGNLLKEYTAPAEEKIKGKQTKDPMLELPKIST